MSFIPKPHEIYKHFKGNLYQITAIAEHTETGEQLVIYQALYGDFKTYARPLDMFVSRVDRGKYPDAEQEFRFELQGPDGARQREEPRAGAEEREPQRDSARRTGPEGAEDGAALGGQPGLAREKDAGRDERGGAAPKIDPRSAGDAERGSAGAESEEVTLDPMVLEFLDADGYEERLNILAGLHHRITNEMIITMAIACDIELNDGDVEERYESLRNCLLTLERYECNRLR